jgi:heat-inducible transcriptional repressor
MPDLSERQETILALIIHEYIDSAVPVGSKTLVEHYGLGVSTATVRSEMVSLTEEGLLRQPHTSAGRVPSEEGYRYFVRRLLRETELPSEEKRLISHQFHQARAEVDEWVRLAAAVLARHSRVASVVTAPHAERAIYKHLELISTQARQALLVLVLQGGEVRQQMLSLAESIEQARLTLVAEEINRACVGKDAQAVAAHATQATDLEHEVSRLVAEIIARADAVSAGAIVHDGIANVLTQPEFSDASTALSALRLLEEHSFLEEVLAKALSPSIGGVQVVIGGEGAWQELKDCSMILARYGAPGFATGALGVLGPTRMAYGRTISAVRYVAGLMSDLLVESYAG